MKYALAAPDTICMLAVLMVALLIALKPAPKDEYQLCVMWGL